jgi:hypothetical protein
MSLETIMALLDSDVELYRDKDGKLKAYDLLLKICATEPERGLSAIKTACQKSRTLMRSVHFWATSPHVDDASKEAQIALADILFSLKESGLIKKLGMPATKVGGAFSARWKALQPSGRRGSAYAAIRKFVMELTCHHQQTIRELVGLYPNTLPDESPAYKKAIAPLFYKVSQTVEMVAASSQNQESSGQTIVLTDKRGNITHRQMSDFDLRFLEKYLDSCLLRFPPESLWQHYYAPMAAELWPAFARENVDFRGWQKVGRGLPLSTRKRIGHLGKEEVDLGYKRMETRIREGILDHLRFAQSYHGIGLLKLPDGGHWF